MLRECLKFHQNISIEILLYHRFLFSAFKHTFHSLFLIWSSKSRIRNRVHALKKIPTRFKQVLIRKIPPEDEIYIFIAFNSLV